MIRKLLSAESRQSRQSEKARQIVAAVLAAIAWLGIVILTFGRSPQTCILFTIMIVPVLAWLVYTDWKIPTGPSPENSLQQLLAAKRNCDHNASRPENRIPQ